MWLLMAAMLAGRDCQTFWEMIPSHLLTASISLREGVALKIAVRLHDQDLKRARFLRHRR